MNSIRVKFLYFYYIYTDIYVILFKDV